MDSDWAADLDSRRSHTGYVLMLTGGAVSWKFRRQDCVSLSTSEAEYVAASQCGQEVDDDPFIVLTETKFSIRYIPFWARYSPLRTRVEAHAIALSP